VIYWLHRPGAHQLPAGSAIEPPERFYAPESGKPNADEPRDDSGVPLDKVGRSLGFQPEKSSLGFQPELGTTDRASKDFHTP